MKTLLKVFLFHIIVIFSFNAAQGQQDTRYSQFMFNGMRINPAYSGIKDHFNATAFYRHQWLQIQDAPRQMFIGIHDAVGKQDKVGLGLQLEHDKIGVDQRTNIFASYAYKFKFNKGTLSAGIQGGATFFRSALTDITTPEEIGDKAFSQDEQFVLPNFGAGLFYHSHNYYIGISIPHLLTYQKDEEDDIHTVERLTGNYREYMLTMGGQLAITEEIDFRPAFLLQYIPAEDPVEIMLNASIVVRNAAWFGITYRSNEIIKPESLNFQLAYKMDRGLKIGYSYDYTLKPLGYSSSGTHEIMVGIDLNPANNAYPRILW